MIVILLFAAFLTDKKTVKQVLPEEGFRLPEEINTDLTGDEEEDTYNIATSIDPESSKALWRKGVEFRKQGKYEDSLKTLQEAALMNPGKPGILYSLSVTYLKIGKFDEALDYLDKSIKISPTPRAWHLMGVIHGFRQNYQKSLDCLDESLKLEPSVSALYSKGNTLDDMERDQEAIAHYDRALEMSQKFPAVWYSRGIVLIQLNRYGEARTSFEMAEKLNYPRAGDALEVLRKKSF